MTEAIKEKQIQRPLKIGQGPYQVHIFLIEARGISLNGVE